MSSRANKKFENAAVENRQESSPAIARCVDYRDANTQISVNLDSPVLMNYKFENTPFEIDGSTGWIPPRPKNPGLRMANYTHYGSVSISSSSGTRRSPVAFTPSPQSTAPRSAEQIAVGRVGGIQGQDKRGFWDRLFVGLWMAYGNRPYV
jgi:hypothetical protein